MKHQDGVALEVHQLKKVFRDRGACEVRAVDGISFRVAPGEVVGLLGPNGAGKTTTIKCILGLIRPTSGQVAIFGREVASHYPGILSQVSAVLEGSRNLYWRMTVWENIEFFTGIHGLPQREHRRYFEHLVERFGLADKRDVEVRRLSQGMKQKTAVVCALAELTPIVFLDEPTLGLDVETSYELRETLKDLAREEMRTVVLSSHNMDVVQDVCQRVIIMSAGRVVADDSIEHLMALFRTRAYRLVLRGPLPEGLQAALAAHFPGLEVQSTPYMTHMRLRLPGPDDIYVLMDLLRDAGARIEEISQEEPDLEKVFLEIVRKERVNQCNS
ncbi:MAG: ABC transporter ATP-binding protein [Bacillota bacterium]|nr:ABC transporter ATP-binding protein [Bacillota bacterium]